MDGWEGSRASELVVLILMDGMAQEQSDSGTCA
jgi:hypothetical protein